MTARRKPRAFPRSPEQDAAAAHWRSGEYSLARLPAPSAETVGGIMVASGLSMGDLAARLQVDGRTLQRWKGGERAPSYLEWVGMVVSLGFSGHHA